MHKRRHFRYLTLYGKNFSYKKGGIVLEAAITLPPVLILIALFLLGLVHEQEKLKLTQAIDRAASEIALVIPLEQTGMSAAVDTSGQLPSEWLTVLETAGLETFAQLRIDYWLRQEGMKIPARKNRSVAIEWVEDRNYAWLTYSTQSQHLGYRYRTSLQTLIPLWLNQAESDSQSTVDPNEDFWSFDNFTRGQMIRKQFAANLPDDFPVIAKWQEGVATAIHSLDLTAPTYLEESEFTQAVDRWFDRLAGFSGTHYVRKNMNVSIANNEIVARNLILVIPDNSSQEWLSVAVAKLKQDYSALGVKLTVHRLGISHRYDEKDVPFMSQTEPS